MNSSNQKLFFLYLQKKLKIKNKEDWYSLSKDEFEEEQALPLLSLFQFSIYKMISSVFPNVHSFYFTYSQETWLPWRFKEKLSESFWEDKEHRRKFFEDLTKLKNFK